MKISFVIPSFRDRRILETIESIKNNVHNHGEHLVEIVVQDGGSDDFLADEIISALSSTDKFIREKDSGIFDGINKGIGNSTGDLIATLGSDDRVIDLDLCELFHLYTNGYNFFQFNIHYTDANWKPVRFWRARSLNHFNLYIGRQFAHFGMVTTKQIFEKAGLFNLKNSINADYEFFYNCVKNKNNFGINSLIVNKVFVQMKMGGNSSAGFMAVLRGNARLLKFIWSTDKGLIFGFFLKPLHKLEEIIIAPFSRK